MTYSFTMLTTRPDCEALLNIAKKEKKDLDYRKISLERRHENVSGTSIEVETELQAKRAEIAALETLIAGLPEGPTKEKTIFDKEKAQYRVLLLTKGKSNYGIVSLIDTELDIGCIEKQMEEVDAFIVAVTDYMNNKL